MEEVIRLFERLENRNSINTLKLDTANLIAKRLYEKRDELGYFDKLHLAKAIGYLRDNSRVGGDAWLRACLSSLQHAWTPTDQQNQDYAPRDSGVEDLTYDDLMSAVRALGGHY